MVTTKTPKYALDLLYRKTDVKYAELDKEKGFTFVQSKATATSHWWTNQTTRDVLLLKIGKELIFHTGSAEDYKSLMVNAAWAGGLNSRRGRQACRFSALNLQGTDSRCRTDHDSKGRFEIMHQRGWAASQNWTFFCAFLGARLCAASLDTYIDTYMHAYIHIHIH